MPHLPAELQLLILENCEWDEHQTLAKVCKFWRNTIKTSPILRESRYIPYQIAFANHRWRDDDLDRRPKPRLHQATRLHQAFILGENGRYRPCNIRLDHAWCRHGPEPMTRELPSGTQLSFVDYTLFQDDPVITWTGGVAGEPVPVLMHKTGWIMKDHTPVKDDFIIISAGTTVGDYMKLSTAAVNRMLDSGEWEGCKVVFTELLQAHRGKEFFRLSVWFWENEDFILSN